MKLKYGQEKLPIKKRGAGLKGGSEIGLILVVFVFFICVLLPLVLNFMEIKSAQETLERARLAADLSASEMILTLNPKSLSEGHSVWASDVQEIYLKHITEKFTALNIEGHIESLQLTSDFTGKTPCLKIYFKWQYVPVFLKNDFYKRYMEVHYRYEFPIL